MLTAITHKPSANLANCELTFIGKDKIDFSKAVKQHNAYCIKLQKLGAKVITLEKNSHLPDSVFVEDAAIVLPEIAIITSLGVESRRGEIMAISDELSKFRSLERIKLPATIEGGDVLQIGNKLFVGQSTRTNNGGIDALRKIASDYGYEVIGVEVTGCLHLTTGCTALEDSTVLINPDWLDSDAFDGFEQIKVPSDEPFAGNILRVKNTILIHEGFEKTRGIIENRGYKVETINISEFLKAEAALTCMSIIFEA